ncbi:MAG: IS1634 family transposase [Flavobacteriales bacterium]|nr:IS1634 family transposase [Flavobacteriales bacterium]MCB9426047.1 IS1634 family transposase [Flavobacteriales bacterium]MCB9426162.1 IS1634 family transposase [Flavobacteriales bacterium]MCB9426286.1 IS1634 family transposase [Flavobacteriales bacterium]
MFVRKKKNKSGVVSIQVIDKSLGKYKMIKTIGCSSDIIEIDALYQQGLDYIQHYEGQKTLEFTNQDFKDTVKQSIRNISIEGISLLLGKIYSEIGFDKVCDDLLKQLVLVRLSHPASKLKTSQNLHRYFSVNIKEDRIYRYLDKIYSSQKERLQQISYTHTKKILGGVISVVFYDVTTLYFQIDNEDEIRRRGFSKEGKHQNPQIVLGLLVGVEGYPLAYEIHQGNTFEGHTMLPIIDTFKSKYDLKKLIVVADSGLLSSANVKELQDKGYEFILGARIKNESEKIKGKILAQKLEDKSSTIIDKEDGTKLILGYTERRAQKDKYNRDRGLIKLEQKVKSGKLTKSSINNRGYNKYLKLDGQISIEVDYDKFNQDAVWDGLKGYLTNTSLTKDEIINNYGQLWKIEKAFRISKHDLKIRPIYHRLQKRIESHITINFVAYKVYKELERQLKLKKANMSPEKAIDIAKTIYAIQINDPINGQEFKETLLLNEEQKNLAKLFNF